MHAFFSFFFSHMFSHSIFIGRSADWYVILWENEFRSVVSAMNQMHVHSRLLLSRGDYSVRFSLSRVTLVVTNPYMGIYPGNATIMKHSIFEAPNEEK